MARSKEVKAAAVTITADEINAGPLAAKIAADVVPRWREGTWAGVPNYSCVRCPFATLDIERIRSHRCEP